MISLYLSLTVLEFPIDQAVLEQIFSFLIIFYCPSHTDQLCFFIVFHVFYAFITDVFKLVSSDHLLLVNRSKTACLCLIFCNSANSLINFDRIHKFSTTYYFSV